MLLSCYFHTDHKFFIFWKQFSLALKKIKKFTRQREFPLAMASGQVEFSSPASAYTCLSLSRLFSVPKT